MQTVIYSRRTGLLTFKGDSEVGMSHNASCFLCSLRNSQIGNCTGEKPKLSNPQWWLTVKVNIMQQDRRNRFGFDSPGAECGGVAKIVHLVFCICFLGYSYHSYDVFGFILFWLVSIPRLALLWQDPWPHSFVKAFLNSILDCTFRIVYRKLET